MANKRTQTDIATRKLILKLYSKGKKNERNWTITRQDPFNSAVDHK